MQRRYTDCNIGYKHRTVMLLAIGFRASAYQQLVHVVAIHSERELAADIRDVCACGLSSPVLIHTQSSLVSFVLRAASAHPCIRWILEVQRVCNGSMMEKRRLGFRDAKDQLSVLGRNGQLNTCFSGNHLKEHC